ncbi:MAG: leucine-rich repeat domain-containing protein [Paludibacteraceae bacterium]|nr:leucine-rich repeat domain-containing protein [Paludibacteraceae bacterium]
MKHTFFLLALCAMMTAYLQAATVVTYDVTTKSELTDALKAAASLSSDEIARICIHGDIDAGTLKNSDDGIMANTLRNVHFVGVNDSYGRQATLRMEMMLPKGTTADRHFSLHFENLRLCQTQGVWGLNKHLISFKDDALHYMDTLEFLRCELTDLCRSIYRAETTLQEASCGKLKLFRMENCQIHNGVRQSNGMPLVYFTQQVDEIRFLNNTFYDLTYPNGIVTFGSVYPEVKAPVKFTFNNNTVCAWSKTALFNFDNNVTVDSEYHIKNNFFLIPYWADDMNSRFGDTYTEHGNMTTDGTNGIRSNDDIEARIFNPVELTNISGGFVQLENNVVDGYQYQDMDAAVADGDIIPCGDKEDEETVFSFYSMGGEDFAWSDFLNAKADRFEIDKTKPAYTSGKNNQPIGDNNNYLDASQEDEDQVDWELDGLKYTAKKAEGVRITGIADNAEQITLHAVVDIPEPLNYAAWALKEMPLFTDNTTLRKVTFDDNSVNGEHRITTIPDNMFSGCTALEEVVLPDRKLLTIGESAFAGTALESIDILSTVTAIGASAFAGCPGLETLDLSALAGTTLENADRMVADCPALRWLELPDDMTVIPEGFAQNDTELSTLSYRIHATEVGAAAFSGCSALGTGDKLSYYFPDVTTVRTEAFKGTAFEEVNLTDIDLLEAYAFADITGLKHVIVTLDEKAALPDIPADVFPADVPVYLPCNVYAALSETSTWKQYDLHAATFDYDITLYSQITNGYVSIDFGLRATMPDCDGKVTVSMADVEGVTFLGWYLDDTQLSTAKTYTFTASDYDDGSGHIYLTAVYELNTYTVTFALDDPNEKANLVINGSPTDWTFTNVTYGTLLDVQVQISDPEYEVVSWSDDPSLTSEPMRQYTVHGDAEITVTVDGRVIDVELACDETMGAVVVSPEGELRYGHTYTITAMPKDGYRFTKWEDGETSASRDITVTGWAYYYAVFEKQTEPTALDDVEASPAPRKLLRNGILYIEYNGTTYTPLGAPLN